MNYPIKKYHGWLLEEEKDKSRKYKEIKAHAKVVFKPIDDTAFLVKYKNQAALDANKNLAGQPGIKNDKILKPDKKYLNDGWDQTVKFLERAVEAGKGPDSSLMEKIRDVGTAMIAVYQVSRKLLTYNKIVVTYTLYPKSDFQDLLKDPDIKALDATTAGKYAINDTTAAKIRNRVLNIDSKAEVKAQQIELEQKAEDEKKINTGEPGVTTTQQTTGKKLTIARDIPFTDLKFADPKGKIFPIIKEVIFQISRYAHRVTEKGIIANPAFKESISELKSNRIGNATIGVLSALKKTDSTFNTVNDAGEPEDMLNQTLLSEFERIINAPSLKTESKGYTLDPLGKFLIESKVYEDGPDIVTLADLIGSKDRLAEFIKLLKEIKIETSGSTSTSTDLTNVKYPIKYGVKDNEDLKKVQRLILKKLAETSLGPTVEKADNVAYNAFVNTWKDDGDYGTTTTKIINVLAAGLGVHYGVTIEVNGGASITQDFVNKLSNYNVKSK
jgi:hypothetical protein